MKTTTQRSLTELTREVTAFPTFASLAEAMDAGYTPSLLTSKSRSKSAKEKNGMVTELADRLEAMGYQVWRG